MGGYTATARPAAPAVAARPAAPPVVTAGAPVASAAADGPTIRIKNYQFETPSLTVPAGTTVSWLNDDVDVHTATSRTPSAPDRPRSPRRLVVRARESALHCDTDPATNRHGKGKRDLMTAETHFTESGSL